MSKNYLNNSQRSQDEIKKILMKEWDPIGIANIPEAQDEYDAYIRQVYHLLIKKASWQQIFDYLWWVETDHMALLGDRQKTEYLARYLCDVFEVR